VVVSVEHRLLAPEVSPARDVAAIAAVPMSAAADDGWEVRRRPERPGPALMVVPTLDPVADQGRAYATRLREAGTSAQLSEHPGATHAFLSMPGVAPQAKAARAEITRFLGRHLTG
jgi:acetyl esterase/lipase